uniref:Uncharacterized protein n=1 Tax=Ixodes ricinus TaxID=34613 RepID=A0A090XDD2_IXORI
MDTEEAEKAARGSGFDALPSTEQQGKPAGDDGSGEGAVETKQDTSAPPRSGALFPVPRLQPRHRLRAPRPPRPVLQRPKRPPSATTTWTKPPTLPSAASRTTPPKADTTLTPNPWWGFEKNKRGRFKAVLNAPPGGPATPRLRVRQQRLVSRTGGRATRQTLHHSLHDLYAQFGHFGCNAKRSRF